MRKMPICLLCSLVVATGLATAGLPLGLWAGGVGELDPAAGRWFNIFVQFDEVRDGVLKGRVPLDDGDSFEGRVDHRRVSFAFRFGGERVRFNGTLSGDTLSGTCKRDGASEPCLLVHEGTPDADHLTEAAGLYSIGDNHRIVLSKSFHLIFEDLKTGEIRALYRAGGDRFTAGPALSIPRPVQFEVLLERDDSGRTTGLRIDDGEGPPLVARRCCAQRREPFEFSAPDGIRLRGTLYLPDRPGPHPGVVWVHGSGKQGRGGAGNWPWLFTDLGFAFLAVDKRGVGESDGDYPLPGGGHDNRPHMVRRSKDVRAAMTALAAHAEVRDAGIGLIGASQAGWVIPMAAANNTRTAFSIVLSGGATNLSYESVYSKWADENGSGIDSTSIDEVLQRTRRHKPRDASFDAFFESMHGPGLWLYGGKDRSNPSQLCIEMLERIRERSSKDFTVRFFPDGNHGLMQARYGGAAENLTLSRRVPGLNQAVVDWLREKSFVQR